jgi:hypothetical protein
MRKQTQRANRKAITARWAAKVRIDREANRPASSSWWIGLDRETFYAEARRQAERWTGVTTPEPRA